MYPLPWSLPLSVHIRTTQNTSLPNLQMPYKYHPQAITAIWRSEPIDERSLSFLPTPTPRKKSDAAASHTRPWPGSLYPLPMLSHESPTQKSASLPITLGCFQALVLLYVLSSPKYSSSTQLHFSCSSSTWRDHVFTSSRKAPSQS